MAANLLTPPTAIPPPTALALSQKAPLILAHPPTSSLPWPLSLLFSRETPEAWAIHENLFLAALRAGDESSAEAILTRLEARFGAHNERIVALRGIYNEAAAASPAALSTVFDGYEKILRGDPTNTSIRKRRVAVLNALGRPADALTALTVLLENSPTDAEAWAEASTLYAAQGAWSRAVYCAEEVLLLAPLGWSAHAHVATLHFLSTTPPTAPALALALKHFLRAAELNENYLRAFYGVKLTASKLLPLLSDTPTTSSKKRTDDDETDIPLPPLATVQKLDELATRRLGDFIRTSKDSKTAYNEAEIAAARQLLAQ